MSNCTVAISSKVFDILAEKIKHKNLSGEVLLFPKEESHLGVHIKWRYNFTITDIKIKLLSDNSIKFQDLKIQWNRCELLLYEIDIPEICIGGQCILTNPFTGQCILHLPKACIFEGKEFPSDHPIIIDLMPVKPFAQSEIFFVCTLDIKYIKHEDRTPTMTDLEAEEQGYDNKWEIVAKKNAVDVDLIDFSGIFSKIVEDLENFLKSFIDEVLSGFHPSIREALKLWIVSSSDLIKKILNIVDDLDEWLTENLRIPIITWFDEIIVDTILFLALNYKIKRINPTNPLDITLEKIDLPIQSIAERMEMKKDEEIILKDEIGKVQTDANGNEVKQKLIPVKIKINDLQIRTTEEEMLLTWKVGI